MLVTMFGIVCVVALLLLLLKPGLINCHDFTISRVFNHDNPDQKNGFGAQELRGRLKAAGYKPFTVSDVDPNRLQQSLRAGDVLLFGGTIEHGGDHSAVVVTSNGRISHMLQTPALKNAAGLTIQGTFGRFLTRQEAKAWIHDNGTEEQKLIDVIKRRFGNPVPYFVWRKNPSAPLWNWP
jgi:hypothetical protein